MRRAPFTAVLFAVLALSGCGLALGRAPTAEDSATTVAAGSSGDGQPSPFFTTTTAPTTTTSTTIAPFVPMTTSAPTTTAPPETTTTTRPVEPWCAEYEQFTAAGTKLIEARDVTGISERADEMIAAARAVRDRSTGDIQAAASTLLMPFEAFRADLSKATSAAEGFAELRSFTGRSGTDIQRFVELGGAACDGQPGNADFGLIPG
jgi:hypothetical protein